MSIEKIAAKVEKKYGVRVGVCQDDRSIILSGECLWAKCAKCLRTRVRASTS